jgi:hypothetical protein
MTLAKMPIPGPMGLATDIWRAGLAGLAGLAGSSVWTTFGRPSASGWVFPKHDLRLAAG